MPSVEIRAFVFTDIVGSTRLKKQMPGRDSAQRDHHFAEQILRPHRKLIETGLAEHEGRIVSTQGDGHFLEFRNPIQAVTWAIEVQQLHAEQPIETPDGRPLGIKIGIHMGPASADPHEAGNYIGTSVDYAARLVQLATERRIIVSEVVATFVREEDFADIRLHEHGAHELPGIGRKLVFEIVYDDHQPASLSSAPGSSSAVVVGSSAPEIPATAATLREPLTGLRIKDYELLEEIAEGGMGKVFKARHVGMGRICVLKLIKDSLLGPGNKEILERFYREINVVARLKHPNIIQAYHSSSRDDQYHFLVLEYVDGITLDRLVSDSGPLSLSKACELVRQTAEGLQYIHAHGLVHRDIKPSNLMLANEGNSKIIKILDLGLALLVGDNVNRITQHDQRAMGTAYYMAPEQWASTTVDIRADIYSLGCTFYHLIAGHPPFQNSNYNQEFAHRTVAPPPLDTTTDMPLPLWRIIEKTLAKKPEDRYVEPGQLCEALDTFRRATTIAPAMTPISRHESSQQPSTGNSAQPNDDTLAGTQRDESTTTTRGPGKPPSRRRPWILGLAVLLGAFALFGLVRRMNDESGRVVDSPQHAAAARHFLLAMPGMNGEWWFDEVPWFFPEMRLHLLKHLSVSEYTELKSITDQPDPPNVPAFYDQLQTSCEESLNVDAPDQLVRRFNLLKAAHPFDEVAENKDESIWARIDRLLEEQRQGSANFKAEDLHLRGLLYW
ncbi:MAG TPA: protein kinase, partial [Pirellulales bacterium]|nr:protein kinase [Pirellulales bacterium]